MKIVSPKIQVKSVPKGKLSLKEYHARRDTILITREVGGLGDILMHRMIFRDLHERGLKVHFACPLRYHDAVKDHPYIDKVLDCAEAKPGDYLASYNTTTICGRYETAIAPRSDMHRADIWARHCGFGVKDHSMHFRLSRSETEYGRFRLDRLSQGRPTVAICPMSAQFSKNLMGTQITGLVSRIREMGLMPFGLHSRAVPEIQSQKCEMITGLTIREWMGIIAAADYVVSVDTSAFHMAGGLGKPLVGVFSWADGKTYGKYFDFELVQRHRDDGNWDCGPCYTWMICPKSNNNRKPCITEIGSQDIVDALARLVQKEGERKNAAAH